VGQRLESLRKEFELSLDTRNVFQDKLLSGDLVYHAIVKFKLPQYISRIHNLGRFVGIEVGIIMILGLGQ
jgi:hypothetical protein